MKKLDGKDSKISLQQMETLIIDALPTGDLSQACPKEKLLLDFCTYYMSEWNGPINILEALDQYRKTL